MSFTIVRNNSRARFGEVQLFLNHLTALEPNIPTDPISTELKIMKGLYHVHLYAALEKTLNELIENTLTYIASHNIQNLHYSTPFNTISLINRLKAFKDCGYKYFFEKAVEIFSEMTSSNIGAVSESAFSTALQNVWTETIEEVLRSFGIHNHFIEPRLRYTINEIVEKRNAVAHGRESATVIGERFRTDILRVKTDLIMNFSFELIDLFEDYYITKSFLKRHFKNRYTV